MQTTKPTTTKPAASAAAPKRAPKPRTKRTKPDAAKPDTAAAIVSRGLARDAATVIAQRTNFDQYSDRDTAYLRFFGGVMRANGGKATLAQIHAAGKLTGDAKRDRRVNPHYIGSAKATDAGAINRLIKAGYVTKSADGHTLTVTATGAAQAAYLGKR